VHHDRRHLHDRLTQNREYVVLTQTLVDFREVYLTFIVQHCRRSQYNHIEGQYQPIQCYDSIVDRSCNNACEECVERFHLEAVELGDFACDLLEQEAVAQPAKHIGSLVVLVGQQHGCTYQADSDAGGVEVPEVPPDQHQTGQNLDYIVGHDGPIVDFGFYERLVVQEDRNQERIQTDAV